MDDTEGAEYAERLERLQNVWWKRVLPVQLPYRWNLRRQGLGRTLDVGCGIGRNLGHLPTGSVGVDHNPTSVEAARSAGYAALTIEEFLASEHARESTFDGMLLAHVIEHMDERSGREILEFYLPYLRPGGKVFFVCPQERGYDSDPTHVRFTTGADLATLAEQVGLEPRRPFSFPLPRRAGRAFVYNEFCLLAVKPA